MRSSSVSRPSAISRGQVLSLMKSKTWTELKPIFADSPDELLFDQPAPAGECYRSICYCGQWVMPEDCRDAIRRLSLVQSRKGHADCRGSGPEARENPPRAVRIPRL